MTLVEDLARFAVKASWEDLSAEARQGAEGSGARLAWLRHRAPGETCRPSDNLGAVLAAAEYAGALG